MRDKTKKEVERERERERQTDRKRERCITKQLISLPCFAKRVRLKTSATYQ